MVNTEEESASSVRNRASQSAKMREEFEAKLEEQRKLFNAQRDLDMEIMRKMMEDKLSLHGEKQKTRDKSYVSDRASAREYYSRGSRERPRRDRREREEPRDQLAGFKVKIPTFHGTSDPDEYVDWEKKVELVFSCHDYSEETKFKMAVTEFSDYALNWWDQIVTTKKRLGDFPIITWTLLKAIMRKRFVPNHYSRDLHQKLRGLVQGNRTVDEYFKEMESLLIKVGIQEENEALISRFLSGLNQDILDKVELQPYEDIEELLHKATLIEKQVKRRGSKFESKRPVYIKDIKKEYPKKVNRFPKPKVEEDQKGKAKARARDIRCYKCQGMGHYANECVNKRVMVVHVNGEVESEDELENELEESLGSNSEHEEAQEGKLMANVAIRALSVIGKTNEKEQRENLFHTHCLVKGNVCSLIIDGGSCTNVASEAMVNKLGLEKIAHPRPYKLQWLNNIGELSVSNQVRVPFSIGKYVDEIMCDILPMESSHILLGRP